MAAPTSFWEKTKAATAKAAAATSRAAQRTKLKTEIMALNREVTKAKSEFGVLAYDLVVSGDLSGAQRVAQEKRVKIDNWKALITAKRAEIARLNEEARLAGDPSPPPSSHKSGINVGEEDDDGNVVI